MEGGGTAGAVEEGKDRKVAALSGEEEFMGAGASRGSTVDSFRVGASPIGSGDIVEEPADLPAGDSATVEADGDAGPSTLAGVAAGAAVIGMAGQASGDVSLVEVDMQNENINKLLKQEVGEGSKKRKLEEVVPDEEVVESVESPLENVVELEEPPVENVVEPEEPPVENAVDPEEPPHENAVEPEEPPLENAVQPVEPPLENAVQPVEPPYAGVVESDSSLEYDSQDSAESVDSRNIESFKTKILKKLEDGSLRFKKRGRFYCPWHTVKPKDGMLVSLKQHAKELSTTGTSKKIRAEHGLLLQILAAEGGA